MRKKISTVLTAAFVLMSVTACCGAYKSAVQKYASTLQQRGKLVYTEVVPELKKELVLNDATLACLVDKDNDRGKDSSACTCADGLPDAWESNCANWLR